MRNLLIILGIIVMANLSTPALAGETALYKLSNGLTILIQPDQRFPLVSMRLYVHAGSAYETPNRAGISHLLEHMVFLGTEKRGPGESAREIEGLGGYMNAATSFDYTAYIVDLPAEHWRTGLDVLKDMAFHARIDEEALETEKKVVIAELKRNEDNPSRRLFNKLQGAALTGTFYEHPIIGYEEVIDSISRQDIHDYIADFYQPQSMLLVVTGHVCPEDLRPEIERVYGGLINRKGYTFPALINPLDLPENGPNIIIQAGPWNKIYLGLAVPTFGERDARSVPLDVLSGLIGGGKTSYLYRKYKYQMRLVDSIFLGNYSFERIGLLYFSIVLDVDKFRDFWDEFTKDLAIMDQLHFSQEELDRVKLNLEDDLFRARETLAGFTDKLGHFTFFGQPGIAEDNYLRQLRQTRLEDLRGLLDTLALPRLSLVLLMPQAAQDISEDKLKSVLTANWPATKIAVSDETNKGALKEEVLNLDQGRTLILRPDKTMPYIAGNLMFSGGDALLEADTQGLAALTAATLTKGSAGKGATELEDFLADRAASLTAAAGRQNFSISFTCPAHFNRDLFGLLKDTVLAPSFQAEELERSRQNLIASIKSSEDQPLGLAFRRLFPFLYGSHPYGFMQLGTPESLQGFTIDQLKAFWDKQKTRPWTLSVCGDFEREEVIAAAQELPLPSFGTIKLASPGLAVEKKLTLKLPERQQSHLLLTFPTAPMGDADAPGLQLLQATLSGMSGLLFTELRERQSLGYSVTAIPWNAQKAGLLIFYIGTEPEKAEQAKEGFANIVAELHEKDLSVEILERAKNTLLGEYYRGMQSFGARSSESATLFTLGLPLDAVQKQIEATRALTSEDLRRLARKYLDLDQAYWIEVRP